MSKVIHLISDLHLSETAPDLTALFEHYINNIAPNSEQLFVLGDLFDVWVGDDNDNIFSQKIISLLRNYSSSHKELFICHGNRDFLIGQSFAKKCGAQLINEPYNFQWQNKYICLMHGDSLCIDDTEYQNFRTMVRTKKWQQEFLNLPIKKRLEVAAGIRKQSENAQKEKAFEIMDVNSEAVIQCFNDNQNHWLIHGHTHREGQHNIDLANKQNGIRIVLSDWGKRGHYLQLKGHHFHSQYFNLSIK